MSILNIQAVGAGQAELQIDLTAYLSSCVQKKEDLITESDFNEAKCCLVTEITNSFVHEDFFQICLEGAAEENIAQIKRSSAYVHIKSQFVELVKNAVDAHIEACLSQSIAKDTSVSLILDIALLDNNNITVALTDNGPGFSNDFLQANGTKSLRASSNMGEKQSSLKQSSPLLPYLIGGAGIGLKSLAALADHGRVYHIEPPSFEVNQHPTGLVLSNLSGEQTGANISLTSSLTPLKPIYASTNRAQKSSGTSALQLPAHIKRQQKAAGLSQKQQPTVSGSAVIFAVDNTVDLGKIDYSAFEATADSLSEQERHQLASEKVLPQFSDIDVANNEQDYPNKKQKEQHNETTHQPISPTAK